MSANANDANLIRQYLADRTVGCPVCQYNLRGTAGTCCPECGTTIELHLVLHDIRLRWWLVGVLAVALPLGFVGIFACTAAFGAWRSAFWGTSDWWTFGALCGLTIF